MERALARTVTAPIALSCSRVRTGCWPKAARSRPSSSASFGRSMPPWIC
jgi:hypothetical protein